MDISNPQQPSLSATFASDGIVFALIIVDSVAYLGAGRRGVQIVSVRDAAKPVLLGSLDTQGTVTETVLVADSRQVSR